MKKVITLILASSLLSSLLVGCNNNTNNNSSETTVSQDTTVSETAEETTEEEATMQFMTTNDSYYIDDYAEEPTAPINEQTFYDNSTEFVVTEQYASEQKMISQDGYSILGGAQDIETLVLPSEYNGKDIVSLYDNAY